MALLAIINERRQGAKGKKMLVEGKKLVVYHPTVKCEVFENDNSTDNKSKRRKKEIGKMK